MTILFILAVTAALVFMNLYINQKDTLKAAQEELKTLKSERKESFKNGTPISMDLVKEAISFNGFVPVPTDNNWFEFKVQGETYCVSANNFPYIQFYKGYGIDLEDSGTHLDLLKQAAQNAVLGCGIGRITFNETPEDATIAFRIPAVENTYEHLCVSFMDYLRLLNNLVDHHKAEYDMLLQEREEQLQVSRMIDNQFQERTMTS